MGSTETAMQAAANAFGIDRCNKSVRETLASWNEEWAEMFILEIDCVLKIRPASWHDGKARQGLMRRSEGGEQL